MAREISTRLRRLRREKLQVFLQSGTPAARAILVLHMQQETVITLLKKPDARLSSRLLEPVQYPDRLVCRLALEARAHFRSWAPKRRDRSDRRAKCSLRLRQRQGAKFRYRGLQRWCVRARRQDAVVVNFLRSEHRDPSSRTPIARSALCLPRPRQRQERTAFRCGEVHPLPLMNRLCLRLTRSNFLAASSFPCYRFPDESRQSIATNSGGTLERTGDRPRRGKFLQRDPQL